MKKHDKIHTENSGSVKVGDSIQIKAEGYDSSGRRGVLRARVLAKYRRWALVQPDTGYKTTVWLDQRGRVMA